MEFVPVQCPYCFESTELELDPMTEGILVSDCPVCCHPWHVVVTRDENGDASVHVEQS